MKKRIIFLITALASLSLLAIWGFGNKNKDQAEWQTGDVTRSDLKIEINATGTLDAVNTVDVGTQVSGVIAEISADFNDKVEADQVIARLDTRTLETTVQDAYANLKRSEIQLQQAQRAYNNAKTFNASSEVDLSIKEAQANLDKMMAQLELSKKTLERNTALFQQGVIAQVELDNSETDFQSAKANFEAAEVTLDKAKVNVSNVDVESAQANYELAKATLASTQASLNRANVNLDFATITAPISGIVISREVELGQTVAASLNTPTLFVIAADLTKMQIEASIDEADIGHIKEGQLVEFTVDAYLDDKFDGVVKQIRLQPTIVNNVVTYTVIVEAENLEMKLLPGMTANLTIIVDQRTDVVSVPNKALNFTPPIAYLENRLIDQGQQLVSNSNAVKLKNMSPEERKIAMKKAGISRVWVLENQVPVSKQVQIGLSDGIRTEIVSDGLEPGTSVITSVTVPTSEKSETTAQSPFMPQRPNRKK